MQRSSQAKSSPLMAALMPETETPPFYTKLAGINLCGLVAAVPSSTEDAESLTTKWGYENAHKIATATGIHTRHIAPPETTACDLGAAAARNLLTGLQWDSGSIDLLIVVTQTPDYPLPGNAPILQHQLGLRNSCGTLDINSGCSGFVDGIWTASCLLAGSSGKRALIIVGDTTSQFVSPDNINVRPLFGDAVAAIALESSGKKSDNFIGVVPGVDGSGAPYLTVHEGAARNPNITVGKFGKLFMDGPQVFAFTLKQVPKNINSVMQLANWTNTDVDYLVLHQANETMMKHLTAKAGFSSHQMVLALANFGNTGSASIPLAIASTLEKELVQSKRPLNLILCGFGVGWRWSSAAWRTDPLIYCKKITL